MIQKNQREDAPAMDAPEEAVPQGAAAAASPEELAAQLEQARAEAADNADKHLRARAEMENIRRRAETDVANARKYALEQFAGELLQVRDSLELAQGAVGPEAGAPELLGKMVEGLDLTLKLMDAVFEKFAITVVDPQGEKFDPQWHQAITMVDSDTVPAGHVANVVRKGYRLHDRLLRPAMVAVVKPKGQQSGAENA